jgi:hypothetical protein
MEAGCASQPISTEVLAAVSGLAVVISLPQPISYAQHISRRLSCIYARSDESKWGETRLAGVHDIRRTNPIERSDFDRHVYDGSGGVKNT